MRVCENEYSLVCYTHTNVGYNESTIDLFFQIQLPWYDCILKGRWTGAEILVRVRFWLGSGISGLLNPKYSWGLCTEGGSRFTCVPQVFRGLYVKNGAIHRGGMYSGVQVNVSASHQCGPGSIPSWGSDPSAIREKGFVPVWATIHPWVGMLSCWPSLPTFTNPIRRTCMHACHSKELTCFSKRVGQSPWCCDPSILFHYYTM